jgi:excinuclease ABC subunit A
VESLSAYARQFIGQMDKPDVDYIDGLSPAVSIDQKSTSHNPRSTVGTVTEIYDYLRLLFARVGVPHCPVCGREVTKQSAQEIVDAVEKLPEGSRILILAPLVRGRKGTYQAVFEEIRKAGFVRARVDGRSTAWTTRSASTATSSTPSKRWLTAWLSRKKKAKMNSRQRARA